MSAMAKWGLAPQRWSAGGSGRRFLIFRALLRPFGQRGEAVSPAIPQFISGGLACPVILPGRLAGCLAAGAAC